MISGLTRNIPKDATMGGDMYRRVSDQVGVACNLVSVGLRRNPKAKKKLYFLFLFSFLLGLASSWMPVIGIYALLYLYTYNALHV